jgi:hypothetical protein
LVLGPAWAEGFVLLSGPFRKWLSVDIPPQGVPFVIDDRGEDSVAASEGSSDHGVTQVIAAVLGWNEAASRTIVASPVRTPISTLSLADGRNSIVFNDPLGVCTGSCLAVTFIGSFDGGRVETTNGITFAAYTEVDITFNATVDWTTHAAAGGPGCAGEFNIEAVAAHEMGHALGLGHSSKSSATMYAFAFPCDPSGLPLDPDDVAAIQCAYVNGAGCALCDNCPAVTAPATLTCGGVPFTRFVVGFTPGGNVVQLESPAGFEHLQVGPVREGYILCYSGPGGPTLAYDVNDQAAGFGPPGFSQISGPGTVPIEVFRTSADGALQFHQRFSGNSFVGAGGGLLDLNRDGISCNTLEECGNCTNRSVHVLMEVTNASASPITGLVLVRVADIDVDGQPSANHFIRTADSVQAWRDTSEAANAHGVLMQGIFGAAPLEALVQTAERSGVIDCAADSVATPTFGDFAGKLRWDLGSLAPGQTTQVRMHYRRW